MYVLRILTVSVANETDRHHSEPHWLSQKRGAQADFGPACPPEEMEFCCSDVLPPHDGGDPRLDYYVSFFLPFRE